MAFTFLFAKWKTASFFFVCMWLSVAFSAVWGETPQPVNSYLEKQHYHTRHEEKICWKFAEVLDGTMNDLEKVQSHQCFLPLHLWDHDFRCIFPAWDTEMTNTCVLIRNTEGDVRVLSYQQYNQGISFTHIGLVQRLIYYWPTQSWCSFEIITRRAVGELMSIGHFFRCEECVCVCVGGVGRGWGIFVLKNRVNNNCASKLRRKI